MKHAFAGLVALAAGALFSPHGLAQGESQVELWEEVAALGCANCHGDLVAAGVRSAPDLLESVGNLRASFIKSFLSDPHGTQPGSRMPDLLGSLSASERELAVEELVAFLLERANAGAPAALPEASDVGFAAKMGERLFHGVGCVMCHGASAPAAGSSRVPSPPAGGRSLDHVGIKYTVAGMAAFLRAPLDHRPAGLMPDMHLSRDEARGLAYYLVGASGSSVDAAAERPSASLVEAGKNRFRALRCGSCHPGVDGPVPQPAGPARGNVGGGCLADLPAPGSPRYDLRDEERRALRRAVAVLDQVHRPTEALGRTLGAFRCTACHERKGSGGVPDRLRPYLATDEPDLGEYARLPPRLDGVGGKLRRSWMERVLYDGASVRPYMRTRMPIFGEKNVAHLPALFEDIDGESPLTFPKETGELETEARDAAQRLAGVTGVGCVTCHVFNAKPAPSFQGIDLITSPERLRERWFREFLISPQSKLPGIVMPESWPGGVPAYDTLLDGDADRQIAAIWHYLALGRSARDPRGISEPDWNIDVGEKPLVYRGRSRVAGFRGIAVGHPDGLHYAFDANHGALAAVWRGDFVSVNWNGQGAGDFHPRADAAELPRDVAFLNPVDCVEVWPLRPLMTEEEPVNPDPTYPRQYGYRFRGYHLGLDGVPTLRYELGDVSIEDRLTPEVIEGRTVLRRFLLAEAASDTQLVFRALSGQIEALDGGRYRSGRIMVTGPEGGGQLRLTDDSGELLFYLDLPTGRTALELTYDLAD